MGQWLVTANDSQFAVDGLPELLQLAAEGKLSAGDMIQPPGATDWVYASEVPELSDAFSSSGEDDEELDEYLRARGPGIGAILPFVVGGFLLVVAIIGGGAMATLAMQIPGTDGQIIGEGGLTYTQMLVTEADAPLLSQPDAKAKPVATLEKDSTIDLMAKRGAFYKARTAGGQEGWVTNQHVIPMYQIAGSDVHEVLDPLYNPDRYTEVANAVWRQMPDQQADQITVFQFLMRNRSPYDVTDLVILATIKDAKGEEIEKVEIPVQGIIPADGSSWVGSLASETEGEPPTLLTKSSFEERAAVDPELQLRWTDGIEVQMSTEEFTEAKIDILELRAIPDEEALAALQP